MEQPGQPRTGRTSLTQQVTSGLLWMYLSTATTLVLQGTVLVVLARLVSPTDFGLVAATLVVVSFGGLLAQAGLDTALVQRRELTDLHVRAAFGAALALAGATALGFHLAADRLAGIYDLPDIAPMIRVMSVVFLIEGLSLGQPLLARELRFRPLAIVDVVSFGVGYGVVAVVLALRGWGAWALIAGQIGQATIATVAFWILRPHPARPTLRLQPLCDLFRVGSGETLSRIIATVGMHGDSFIVGRWLGATSLGLYDRAYRLMEMPTGLFGQAIRKVMFPAMASFQTDRSRLGRTYLTGVGVLTAATLPVSLVLSALAPELVRIVLGPRWVALVPVFQVLVLGMVFRASPAVSDSVILACGAVFRQATRIAIFAGLVIVGGGVGQRWGLIGVATGVLVAMAGNHLLMAYICLSLTGQPWSAFLRAHGPAATLSVAVLATVVPALLTLRAVASPPVVTLVAIAALAGATELLTVRLAQRHTALAGTAALTLTVLTVLPDGLRRRLSRAAGVPEVGAAGRRGPAASSHPTEEHHP